MYVILYFVSWSLRRQFTSCDRIFKYLDFDVNREEEEVPFAYGETTPMRSRFNNKVWVSPDIQLTIKEQIREWESVYEPDNDQKTMEQSECDAKTSFRISSKEWFKTKIEETNEEFFCP